MTFPEISYYDVAETGISPARNVVPKWHEYPEMPAGLISYFTLRRPKGSHYFLSPPSSAEDSEKPVWTGFSNWAAHFRSVDNE